MNQHLKQKQAIMQAFNRSSVQYDRYAHLQRTVGKNLIDFYNINQFPINTKHNIDCHILDMGSGTGFFSQYWKQEGCIVTAADLAFEMLCEAKKKNSADHYVQCDVESLPFANQQFTMTFSNLMLQWCQNLPKAIAEMRRVTQGKILFTILLDGSLNELEISSRLHDGYQRVNSFYSLEDILMVCHSNRIQWQVKNHTLNYVSIFDLFNDLKGTGAHYVLNPKSSLQKYSGLSKRTSLMKLEEIYRQQFTDLPLTYRVFYGILE